MAENEVSTGQVVAYSFATLADVLASQYVTMYIFTFYLAIAGVGIELIAIAFIIWSIYNAINDPVLGAISDRTQSRWGRRKPWIIAGAIPLCFLIIFIWTPPVAEGAAFVYLLLFLLLFDTFYTMFSLNQVALFPEMYPELEQRSKANTIIQIFSLLALMIGFMLPGLLIPVFENPIYRDYYALTGAIIAIVIGVCLFIFLKFGGLKERPEYAKDPAASPSFLKAIKITLKNKSFATFVVANFATFYVFGMLTVISSLYGFFVLDITSSLIRTLLLGGGLISTAAFLRFWQYISVKYGIKIGHIAAMGSFIFALIPFMFINTLIGGALAYAGVGVGLSGALYFRWVVLARIIDEDELKTGVRREGSYMGVNAFVTRLTTIAIILSIALALGTGLYEYIQGNLEGTLTPSPALIFGLRTLVFILPAILLGIGIISMSQFPITKERDEEIKKQITNLHQEKKTEV
jgi:GPH family glycoside/pentoside/hexuronide:cation symporter